MLKLCSEITIEGDKTWLFTSLVECRIVEDVSTLTDTCEIKIPKRVKWEQAVFNNGKPPVKKGDKITIRLGYDNELKNRFFGFVRSVDAKDPIVIKCEDGMFLLKQKKVIPKAYRAASLKEIMTDLLAGTEIKFQLIDKDLQIGKYRMTHSTVSEELQELKEKYMLNFYFRNVNEENILYTGLAYPSDNQNKLKFVHSKNIISEDFEYQNKEDIRVKIEAITFNKKNEKQTLEIGDSDGEVIKMQFDCLTEEELRKYAQQALDNYKKNGIKGSFETFGVPEVSKCDIVDITSSDKNERVYLVKKNEITFGTNGYRQKIELGQPANSELLKK